MITIAVTWFNAILRWVSGGLMAGMLVLILLQISLRTIQGRGFPWGNELATYLLVWAVCLGIAVAFFERTHLGVELLVSKLGRLRRPVEALAFLTTICFLGILIYYGWSMVESGMRRTSPGLGLPMGYVYLALPVAGAVGILNIVVVMVTGKKLESGAEDAVDAELELVEESIAQGKEELNLSPDNQIKNYGSEDLGDQGKGRTS